MKEIKLAWIFHGLRISLTDLDNLHDPDVLAEEIIENLQAGIESFQEIMLNIK